MAAPSGGVTIPSNVFPDWPKTTDDMLEVCSSVCRGATQSKLFGLPPSEILNEDTVGTTGECYCAVGPPSANEAAVPSEECTAVRIFRNMQRGAQAALTTQITHGAFFFSGFCRSRFQDLVSEASGLQSLRLFSHERMLEG